MKNKFGACPQFSFTNEDPAYSTFISVQSIIWKKKAFILEAVLPLFNHVDDFPPQPEGAPIMQPLLNTPASC